MNHSETAAEEGSRNMAGTAAEQGMNFPGRGGLGMASGGMLDGLVTRRPRPETSVRRMRGLRSRLPRGWQV